MIYYTYRLTCTHPESKEKYYYGFRQSKVAPEKDNYWSSSLYVKEAIKTFGKSNFQKKILKTFDCPKDAIEHEMMLHERLNVDKHPLFFNRCKATRFGFRATGLSVKGRTYEEIYGPKKAKELRKKRSETMRRHRKKHPTSGKNNPNYGNRWSDEMKKKLSEGRQGKDHPAYGSMWINNGVSSRKIMKTESIPDGWVRGRIRTWKNQYNK